MESVLWYQLASSRGGPTRVRIVRALDERPRNANQLAEELDLDYTTVRHHLDVLREDNVVFGKHRYGRPMDGMDDDPLARRGPVRGGGEPDTPWGRWSSPRSSSWRTRSGSTSTCSTRGSSAGSSPRDRTSRPA
ncbi:hypothetical protein BRC93_12250 [Halobacteriales archaeon QS_5_70_15]|nr:MAG: hypothetical protein BRC93_12250 [Halobacteriales archaeon QS_5_70_15]